MAACQLHTLAGITGEQGRLNVVCNMNAAFLAIVRVLTAKELVVAGFLDLPSKLLAEAVAE
jgi:hypothetical protein